MITVKTTEPTTMRDDANDSANGLSTTTTFSTKSSSSPAATRSVPMYSPKPISLIQKHWNHAVQSDDDVWVEHSYQSRAGGTVYYYLSTLTTKCQLLEPPTGAALIVCHAELNANPELRRELRQPLPMHKLNGIPRSKPDKQLEAHVRKKEKTARYRNKFVGLLPRWWP